MHIDAIILSPRSVMVKNNAAVQQVVSSNFTVAATNNIPLRRSLVKLNKNGSPSI